MNHQLDRALRFVVFFTLTLLVAGSIQVASAQSTVEVRPTVVRGVRIVSAELAPDSTSSPQTVVVTLRNDGAASGQMVLLTTLVHDSQGRVKGGGAIPIEIDTPPGGEQVVSHQVDILDVDAGNQLTLELADSGAGSGLLGD